MTEPPAARLLGLELKDGWKVVARQDKERRREQELSGGHFSHGYIVENKDGRRAFLKAFDYVSPLSDWQGTDPADTLKYLLDSYVHERDLLKKCGEKGLSRVIRVLGDGAVSVAPGAPADVVQYLIFELAEEDLRVHAAVSEAIDTAWALRTLHQVAVGLQQLHARGIAHQDLKPSNVMLFDGDGAKLGDLGRATERGVVAPHSGMWVQGDATYAPPELLYGAVPSEWNLRHQGCDLYLLGSLAAFLLSRATITALIMGNLPPQLHWKVWSGPYEDILPFVQDALAKGMVRVEEDLPDWCRGELGEAIRQLCNPDVKMRGHPKQQGKPQIQLLLARYVTLFDRLATKAELRLKDVIK